MYLRMERQNYEPPGAHREKRRLQVVPSTKRESVTNPTGNQEGTGVTGPHVEHATAQNLFPPVETPLAGIGEVSDPTVRRMTATESEVGTAPSTLNIKVVKDTETVHLEKKGEAGPAAPGTHPIQKPLTLALQQKKVTAREPPGAGTESLTRDSLVRKGGRSPRGPIY